MNRSQRREAWIALAMLPVGATVLVGSALALLAVVAMGVDLLWRGAIGWALTWCGFAVAVALWNMRAGIEVMSAFDWRPLPATLLRSALVVAGWLALP